MQHRGRNDSLGPIQVITKVSRSQLSRVKGLPAKSTSSINIKCSREHYQVLKITLTVFCVGAGRVAWLTATKNEVTPLH